MRQVKHKFDGDSLGTIETEKMRLGRLKSMTKQEAFWKVLNQPSLPK